MVGCSLPFLSTFTFFNLLGVSGTWMKDGVTPEWMGRWWVHILMLGLTAPTGAAGFDVGLGVKARIW